MKGRTPEPLSQEQLRRGWVTPREAARCAGLAGVSHVRDLCAKGRLEAIRDRDGDWRITLRALVGWLRTRPGGRARWAAFRR